MGMGVSVGVVLVLNFDFRRLNENVRCFMLDVIEGSYVVALDETRRIGLLSSIASMLLLLLLLLLLSKSVSVPLLGVKMLTRRFRIR
jgi:hypothetical protein